MDTKERSSRKKKPSGLAVGKSPEDNEPYNALQIANWFIKRAEQDKRDLSVMAILKLSYIAHGMHLAKHDTPLFKDGIQAWRYGPVIINTYLAFRNQGLRVIDPVKNVEDVQPTSPVGKLLEDVWGKYGHLRPFKLSALTHIRGGPWDIAKRSGRWQCWISDQLIKEHYNMMANKND